MLENPLNTALGATAITGMLASKPKLQKDLGPTPEEEMIRFNQAREKHGGPLYEPYRKVKPYHETRRYIQPTPEDLMTNKPWQYFDDVHPPIEYYAEGGHVKDLDDEWRDIRGYIDGDDGGQDDNILLDVEPDSYIMNATVTSLLGDGNSKNGKKKLEHWEEEVLQDKHGTISGVSDGRKVKIAISPGERIMSPKFVESVGKGSKKRGGKVLDKF